MNTQSQQRLDHNSLYPLLSLAGPPAAAHWRPVPSDSWLSCVGGRQGL